MPADVRLIRVSSRALGRRATVRVYLYPSFETMRAAAERFAPGEDFSAAGAVTQSHMRERYQADGTWRTVEAPYIVRLVGGFLPPSVVVHELVHAASHLYGDTLGPDTLADSVLLADNEPFAYLVSDLYASLSRRLWATGHWS